MYFSATEGRGILQKDATASIRIKGKGNHAGRAVGKTALFLPDLTATTNQQNTQKNEEALYFDARKNLIRKLRRLYGELRENSGCAWIFLMQISLLCDGIFTELPHLYLAEGKSAQETVLLCRDYFYSVLSKKEGGENLHEVAADIDDVSVRLLNELNEKNVSPPPPQSILLCHTPPASYIAEWRDELAGIITEDGAHLSHHADLALSLGIPYISVKDELYEECSAHNALIDSESGHLYINPDLATLSLFADKHRKRDTENSGIASSSLIPSDTDKKMLVFAELGNIGELNRLSERNCDGIGRFTSEEFYLEQMCLADEELLFEQYRRAAENMPTKPIVIQGLKSTHTVRLESVVSSSTAGDVDELYVLYDSTLRTQIRAVMRAAVYGSLQFLLPQSERYSDISRCAQLMDELTAELYEEDREFSPVPLGSIIDTVPSALMCDKIIEECDFLLVDAEKLYAAICERHRSTDPSDIDSMCFDALRHLLESIGKTVSKKKKRAVLSLGKTCPCEIFTTSLLCEFFAVSTSLENLTKFKKLYLDSQESKRQHLSAIIKRQG